MSSTVSKTSECSSCQSSVFESRSFIKSEIDVRSVKSEGDLPEAGLLEKAKNGLMRKFNNDSLFTSSQKQVRSDLKAFEVGRALVEEKADVISGLKLLKEKLTCEKPNLKNFTYIVENIKLEVQMKSVKKTIQLMPLKNQNLVLAHKNFIIHKIDSIINQLNRLPSYKNVIWLYDQKNEEMTKERLKWKQDKKEIDIFLSTKDSDKFSLEYLINIFLNSSSKKHEKVIDEEPTDQESTGEGKAKFNVSDISNGIAGVENQYSDDDSKRINHINTDVFMNNLQLSRPSSQDETIA